MRFILALVSMVLCVLGSTSFAAMNPDNNPHVMCIALGSPSVDTTVLGGMVHASKSWKVSNVYLLNAAGIAASNTDYVLLTLKKGSTAVASLDTRAGGQGAVVANVAKALSLDSAQALMAAGSVLSVVYDETDVGTNVALSGAQLCIHYAVK
jgi:hypothetical protein